MKKIFILLFALLVMLGCKNSKTDVISCSLTIQLPANRYIHQATFILPDSFLIEQHSFLLANDTAKYQQAFRLVETEIHQIQKIAHSIINDTLQSDYGFDNDEDERMDLIYEIHIVTSTTQKTILLYNPRPEIKLPKDINQYLKLFTTLMSKYKPL